MPTEEQLLEIHRLAVLGDIAEIAQDVGGRLATAWLRVSRFREVRDVSRQTLTLGLHAGSLTALAHARRVLGEPHEALTLYREALTMYEEVGDRAGQAATLSNIGLVYNGMGDGQQALAYYHQALPIQEAVEDRAGESVTRYNLAMLYRAQGKFAEAVEELRKVVVLAEQVQHPNLASAQAMLRQVEQEWQQSLS